jgi:hypothetical protein
MSRCFFLLVLGLSTGCGGKVIFDTGGTMGGGGALTTGGTTTGHTGATTTGSVQTTKSSTTSGVSTIIACNMNACDGTTQECCASPGGAFCVSNNAMCKGLAMHCSSVANCPSPQKCCASPVNGNFIATCEAQCGGAGQQLCATTSECENLDECVDGPQGIRFCVPPPPGTSGAGG